MGYRKIKWACPYYRWDEKTRIHCDGGIIKIPHERDMIAYARRYCAAVPGWEDCTIAKAMNESYEREEQNGRHR